MSSDWPEISIDELKAPIKNAIAMGPFGSRIKAENFMAKGIPVIKGGNLNGDFILEDDFDFLSVEKADDLVSSNAYRRDIVITHRGTIGQVGIIPENSKYDRYVVSQSQLKVSLDQERVNPYFVYYFLRSPLGQYRLLSNASQVGVPAIAQASTSVKGILVPCPDKAIQDRIAQILLNLDHTIELNRQINQTIEQIAQAIFKSWFVDFDPVRAKIAAKQNSQDPECAAMRVISGKTDEQLNQLNSEQRQQLAATAALFPDELVDSKLGEIPRGWETKLLSRMIELIGGGTPKRSEESYWGGDIPWFSVKDAPADGDVFAINTDEKITELGLSKSSTKLLPEGATIISARGTVGRLAMVGVPMAMNQSCYGVKAGTGLGTAFNYFNLKRAVSTLKQQTHGAVFDTITTSTFDSVCSVNPCENSAKEFERIVTPLMEKIKSNLFEIESLTECRNILLPKLLSGEITLGDTHSATEAVV